MSSPPLTEAALKPYRGMGSGIPRALGEWPQIELISEVSGNQFTALVRRPKSQWEEATNQVTPQVTPPVTAPVTPPVSPYALKLLELLALRGPLGNDDIRQAFALKDRRRLRETYLAPSLAAGWIEYTLPDKPNSRLQQYRLTEQGKGLLK
jgi:ATP-dependent DNA helicase RecG